MPASEDKNPRRSIIIPPQFELREFYAGSPSATTDIPAPRLETQLVVCKHERRLRQSRPPARPYPRHHRLVRHTSLLIPEEHHDSRKARTFLAILFINYGIHLNKRY